MLRLITRKRIILLILIIAAFLRLWRLDVNPPNLTADEASFGYNTYSILKTGKDMYGESFPIIFKSFGDFRPGLYFYLLIPSVAIFGLTEFAVRFPNAIFGVLGVYALYLLVREMYPKRKFLPVISAFLLAVNHWHIYYSRGAWEPNVALTLTLFAVYYFYKSFQKEKYLVTAALLFGLTLLTYQGSKLASLLVVLALVGVYRKQIFKFERRKLVGAVLVGLLVSLPIIMSLFQGKTGRLGVVSLFSYRRPVEYVSARLEQGGERVGDLTYNLFHSEGLSTARGVMSRYFNHFSGRFLFFEGDWEHPHQSSPYQGMFLVADLVLILFGLSVSVRKSTKETKFILAWLLLSPIPAVLTRDQVHAVRSLNMVIPLVLVSAWGVDILRKNMSKFKLVILTLSFIYVANYAYFLDSYFVHLSKQRSQAWFYGYKQVVETITPIQEKYEKIKVQQSYHQPFIYFLFYQRRDPEVVQEELVLKENEYGDVGLVEKLGNIEFVPIDWPINKKESGTLIVAGPIEIPLDEIGDNNLIKEIKYLDEKEVAFRIVEIK